MIVSSFDSSWSDNLSTLIPVPLSTPERSINGYNLVFNGLMLIEIRLPHFFLFGGLMAGCEGPVIWRNALHDEKRF